MGIFLRGIFTELSCSTNVPSGLSSELRSIPGGVPTCVSCIWTSWGCRCSGCSRPGRTDGRRTPARWQRSCRKRRRTTRRLQKLLLLPKKTRQITAFVWRIYWNLESPKGKTTLLRIKQARSIPFTVIIRKYWRNFLWIWCTSGSLIPEKSAKIKLFLNAASVKGVFLPLRFYG